MSPIIQGSYEANPFHATLVTTDKIQQQRGPVSSLAAWNHVLDCCSWRRARAHVLQRSAEGEAGRVRKSIPGHQWESPWAPRNWEEWGRWVRKQSWASSSGAAGDGAPPTWPWNSQVLGPHSPHHLLGWAPYPNCLHDLLCGPLVLEAQDSLYFLEAPFSLEGPASLWALALLEEEGNVTQCLSLILFLQKLNIWLTPRNHHSASSDPKKKDPPASQGMACPKGQLPEHHQFLGGSEGSWRAREASLFWRECPFTGVFLNESSPTIMKGEPPHVSVPDPL